MKPELGSQYLCGRFNLTGLSQDGRCRFRMWCFEGLERRSSLTLRIPPSCILDVLLHGRHWGLSWWGPDTDPRGQRPRPWSPQWRCKRSRPVEVYGRCDPCLHEDPEQEDSDATDCPGPLYPCHGKRSQTIPGRRPVDGQQRVALRRGCVGTRSQGLTSASRCVLHGTSGGLFSGAQARHRKSTSAHTPCRHKTS